MPSTRASSKRKLTDFLEQPSPLTQTSRRPKARILNSVGQSSAALSSSSMQKSQPPTIKTEPSLHDGIGPKMKGNGSSRIPENSPLKTENLENEAKFNPESYDMGVPRYQHPKLPAEEDEIVMRKYYPAEMSNARVELYKSGQLPRPIDQIEQAISSTSEARAKIPVRDAVVHWFRGDLRVSDNTALHMASEKAKSKGASLIALFLVSPEDYEAHIKSPARVDFILRTLELLREDLDKLDIPLWVEVVENRKETGKKVLSLMEKWNASHIYGNMEYEVDELRRDVRFVKMALEKNIDFTVVHDSVVAPPGVLLTKGTGKPFTVFSPWFKAWVAYLHNNPKYLEVFDPPSKNPSNSRVQYKHLFGCPIPACPEGKRLDSDEVEYVRSTWPAGEKEALARLQRFLREKIKLYKDRRDLPNGHGTSALSVHFAAGTLSARTAIHRAYKILGNGTLNTGDKGITCWISEVGWRDFYRNVLINFPWVWYVSLSTLMCYYLY